MKISNRKHILIFIDWFYPAFKAGGPITSISNLVNHLHKNYAFTIITSNSDIDGEILTVKSNELLILDKYSIIYLSSDNQSFKKYEKLVKMISPDIIYLNSMFSYHFTVLPLFLRSSQKIILAPRGMLTENALNIKPLKKKIFLKTIRLLFNFIKINWHATSELERYDIQRHFGKKLSITIAKNLPLLSKSRDLNSVILTKNKTFVFVSRISEIKNLKLLLEVFTSIKQVYNLDIYGPIEDFEYWELCKRIIGTDNRINYLGHFEPHELESIITKYHFTILPSKNENYGHSIAESLALGVPVIISDRTPWRNIENQKVGFVIPLEQSLWKKVIAKILEMSNEEYLEYVKNTNDYYLNNILNDEIIRSNKLLFS